MDEPLQQSARPQQQQQQSSQQQQQQQQQQSLSNVGSGGGGGGCQRCCWWFLFALWLLTALTLAGAITLLWFYRDDVNKPSVIEQQQQRQTPPSSRPKNNAFLSILEGTKLHDLGDINLQGVDGVDLMLDRLYELQRAWRGAVVTGDINIGKSSSVVDTGLSGLSLLVYKTVLFLEEWSKGAPQTVSKQVQCAAVNGCRPSQTYAATNRLSFLSRQALAMNYATSDAEDEIYKFYASLDTAVSDDSSGDADCLRQTYAVLGGKLYFRPPLEERGLYLRKGPLVKSVANVSTIEMLQMSIDGTTFIDAFSALKTYQNFTGRACMAMHHLGGYSGQAKRLVGVLINGGRDFIMMVNPVVNGRGGSLGNARYRSTLCGHKFHVQKHWAISVNYIKFESLYYNVALVGSGGGGGGSEAALLEEQVLNPRFFEVRQEWFKGDIAVCLQVLEDEFNGIDLCKAQPQQADDGSPQKQTDGNERSPSAATDEGVQVNGGGGGGGGDDEDDTDGYSDNEAEEDDDDEEEENVDVSEVHKGESAGAKTKKQRQKRAHVSNDKRHRRKAV